MLRFLLPSFLNLGKKYLIFRGILISFGPVRALGKKLPPSGIFFLTRLLSHLFDFLSINHSQ